MIEEHIGISCTTDDGRIIYFDIPHTEADDEEEEVTAYEILSSAVGA